MQILKHLLVGLGFTGLIFAAGADSLSAIKPGLTA